MNETEEFGLDYSSNQLARRKSTIRRWVKSFYISNLLKHVNGATVDMGCGAGQILERLPAGSMGVEVNPFLVADLTKKGFKVMAAMPDPTRLDLSGVVKGEQKSLVLSHVLEHFDNADEVLKNLLSDCMRLEISTVILVVPGAVGYRSDSTHKTFVDIKFLKNANLIDYDNFILSNYSFFPFNLELAGKLFVYNELMIVYQMKNILK